ncbi:MAG: BRCT domain-containing protein [Hymenobacteraceae bacterium]|nr:BRCT domain-containing protein [Hymenobacteraceae bacterium]
MNTSPYDSLAFRQHTTRSEADKAINSLKGILEGIRLDGEVNTAELNELQAWCARHRQLINRNPFKELMLLVQEAASEEANRPELMEDLLWLCQRYEHDSVFYDAATADLQILQGICHGILSDGVINDQEIKALDAWLEGHAHLNSYYPYDEISSLITSVLSDGKVDEQERRRLMAYFNEFTLLTDGELTRKIAQETDEVKISGICTSNPDIRFDGGTFCFTGLFQRATRKEVEQEVIRLGGRVSGSVTKHTDYLIVGDSGNPCWAFACYGRKVEKAITLRREGARVVLVHEYDFWDLVEENR